MNSYYKPYLKTSIINPLFFDAPGDNQYQRYQFHRLLTILFLIQ